MLQHSADAPASLMVSPSSLATRFRFRSEILPDWSSSNRLNTFWMSSRVSLSLCHGKPGRSRVRSMEMAMKRAITASTSHAAPTILAVIMSRNSSKSIVPLPSLSMSAIIYRQHYTRVR